MRFSLLAFFTAWARRKQAPPPAPTEAQLRQRLAAKRRAKQATRDEIAALKARKTMQIKRELGRA